MVWREALIDGAFGEAYPSLPGTSDTILDTNQKKELTRLAMTGKSYPLGNRNYPGEWRLGTLFLLWPQFAMVEIRRAVLVSPSPVLSFDSNWNRASSGPRIRLEIKRLNV